MAKQSPAVPSVSEEFTVAPTPPVDAPRYPTGVTMETRIVPRRVGSVDERSPKESPPGWAGGYHQCGECGDFLGNDTRCERCFPGGAVPNVSMNFVPKMMA